MMEEHITHQLDTFVEHQKISACFIARQTKPNIYPSMNSWKPQLDNEWNIINKNIEKIFRITTQYSQNGLQTMKFRMRDYDVSFFPISDWTTILIIVTPKEILHIRTLEQNIEDLRKNLHKIIKQQNKLDF